VQRIWEFITACRFTYRQGCGSVFRCWSWGWWLPLRTGPASTYQVPLGRCFGWLGCCWSVGNG